MKDLKEHYKNIEKIYENSYKFIRLEEVSRKQIKGVSVGKKHVLMWTEKGVVYGWGENKHG